MKPNGQVHPAAEGWRMFTQEELADLASDIKANGLVHPIVLDADGQLIDGRNRMAACALAGVEPLFMQLPPGANVLAYIRSVNDQRRHVGKGARAMAAAVANSLVAKEFRARQRIALESGISPGLISQAFLILEWAPELVDQVIAGGRLDQAYIVASERKQVIERLGLLLEEIGSDVPLPATADLQTDTIPAGAVPPPTAPLNDSDVEETLQTIRNIQAWLRKLNADAADRAPRTAPLYAAGIRSGAARIAQAARDLYEAYPVEESDHPQIRRVK